ncbi:MAG: carboxypeptidase-like regulatory domain-containing protein [bacterium]
MLRAVPVFLLLAVVAIFMAGCGGSSSATQGGGQVRGVVDTSALDGGTPVVTVGIDGQDTTVPVGADGSFLLNNVPPGVHTLVAKTNNKASAIVVTVADGRETNVGQVILRQSGQISGIVTVAVALTPIANARVTVTEKVLTVTDETPHPVRTARTSITGSYTVDGLPAGEYIVAISKDGYSTATLDLTVAVAATTVGDAQLTAVDVATGSVKGVVSGSSADGTVFPLGGAFIILVPNNGTTPPPVPTVPQPAHALDGKRNVVSQYPVDPIWKEYYSYSADDGSYLVDGVPAGVYSATALRPGFDSVTSPVTVVAKETATLDFKLNLHHIPVGTVIGTVTDANTHNPIAGARVSAVIYHIMANTDAKGATTANAMPIRPDEYNSTAITDAAGKYKLIIPTHTSALVFAADGYEYQQLPVTVVDGGSVTVDAALQVKVVNPHAKVTLKGNVVTPKAINMNSVVPVAGATIYVTPDWPYMSATNIRPQPIFIATTDALGNYSIVVPSDIYTVSASKGNLFSNVVKLKLYADTTQDFTLFTGPVVQPMPGAAGK